MREEKFVSVLLESCSIRTLCVWYHTFLNFSHMVQFMMLEVLYKDFVLLGLRLLVVVVWYFGMFFRCWFFVEVAFEGFV